jgi:hypothetical protein
LSRRARRLARADALLGCLLAAGGCRLPLVLHPPPRIADCPGGIASTRALPAGDFVIREQVRVVGEDVDASFDVVAEKRGDRLVLVGFDPVGAKAFSVIQEGSEVRSESFLGRALQVAPENILRDLHAADFARADASPRAEVHRPGCDYRVVLVRVSRRVLP